MSLKDLLTPENTEEVRPGLFIQAKTKNPDSIIYKVIQPIAWKGEWRLKEQFGWRNFFFIILILFITWSYFTETQFSRQLQEDPCELLPNITSYCSAQEGDDPYNILDHGRGNKTQGYNFTLQDYP